MYSDPDVMEFLKPAVGELEPMGVRFERHSGAGLKSDYGIWASVLKASSEATGSTMLKPLPDSDDEIEIGWHLARPY